jgi:magnesium transporter
VTGRRRRTGVPTVPEDESDAPREERLLPGAVDHHLTHRVPVCLPDDHVGDVRASLSGTRHESVEAVAVCDGPTPPHRLLGLVPLAVLLGADPDLPVGELMDADPPTVTLGIDREEAAWKAVRHGESSLAVLDEAGAFLGVVPASHLLEVLLQAHDDDFARLGGYLASTRAARLAAEERVGRRLWHRLPWLALGLAGAAASAWLVGLFDNRLETDVRLAFFIPGVVYLADAVGTQTEALVVRGLSVGAPVRRSLRLEAITGPALGLLLAAVTLPAVWLALGDTAVAVAVSVALLAACSVATAVAAGLPVVMARRGVDPAFGSGPLATVVQDLLSLVIYFAVAVAVLG